jgi:poly-gamma-glutamate synthesis protein (capsule biosynthesis protein)
MDRLRQDQFGFFNTSLKHHKGNLFGLLILIGLLSMSSCFTARITYTPVPDPDITRSAEITATLPAPQVTQLHLAPYTTWIDPMLLDRLESDLANDSDFKIISDQNNSVLQISFDGTELAGQVLFALAAPFYDQTVSISSTDLLNLWSSSESSNSPYSKLVMTQDTRTLLNLIWAEPAPDRVEIVSPELIADTVWFNTGFLAIVPFEEITPAFKILAVDNIHPFDSASPLTYPLSIPIYLSASDPYYLENLDIPYLGNFHPDRLTTIALTGVTALVRDTAAIMEEKGLLYPADQVRDILTAADITHINNEVPFSPDCPDPDSNQSSLYFCSKDEYIELLLHIGTDIVELSGDHFGDQGPDAMLHSLELYDSYGFQTYGGGKNLADGLQPLILEHNGNMIAFLGCNAKPHEKYATATETSPGASSCDFDWMLSEISRLKSEGYLVIVTMQHEEVDDFSPIAIQLYDFHRLAEAGADIVSGSQAHHPQGFEIDNGSFIHYGLGNLFFDQYYLAQFYPELHINKDKSFIDLHYVYNGRYINTQLIPLQFIDNAQPRVMTSSEESDFLEEIFTASKWEGNWIYLFPAGYFEPPDEQ